MSGPPDFASVSEAVADAAAIPSHCRMEAITAVEICERSA
jgi:hypothetical protein